MTNSRGVYRGKEEEDCKDCCYIGVDVAREAAWESLACILNVGPNIWV